MFQPSVSVIIAVKNAKAYLAQTLASIRAQCYPLLEVIVIDGASTDGTLDVIRENHDLIHCVISEPDKGISDAFNKGLRQATGDYINFQGAGDVFYAPGCLTQLFHSLDDSYQLICGKVERVEEDGVTPLWVAPKHIKPFNKKSLLFKMSLPHQGLFTHRCFFEQFGSFDLKVRFAMDYELLLRAYEEFPKTIIKDVFISRWRAGGVGAHRIMEIFDEYHRIKKQHRVASTMALQAIDAFTRLKYLIKDKLLKMAY
ncbi:glycosyltransferase [Candidatus Berkiella aquae]|uniref:Glycosyltransferase n=1 Tax=Candidatus Berkiella aquae TaxID=295108 RepID=A0A0Q9YW48_9GAMM|nr:glycosyltransferase family 2 protein [Candidatus Berkiella aquae]MCS5712303.1 glycosyltransferase [Candidatus Berkiella aquae]